MRAEYAGSISDEKRDKASWMESGVFSFPNEGKFAERLWVEFLTTHPEFTEVIKEEQGAITRSPTVTLEQALGRADTVRFEDTDVPLSQAADSICARAYQSAKLAAVVPGLMQYQVWLKEHGDDIGSDFGASTAGAQEEEDKQVQTPGFNLAA